MAAGNKSNLKRVKGELEEKGYTVSKTDTTSATQNTTIIDRSNLSEDTIKDIKSILETGVLSSSSKKSTIDITIIIGKDYK